MLAGLDRFLSACPPGGGWTRLDLLLTPAGEIGGVSPLEALRRGDAEAAVRAATTFGELGGLLSSGLLPRLLARYRVSLDPRAQRPGAARASGCGSR